MNTEPDSPPVSRVYYPNELPAILGVTAAMVRQYSNAFESVTGETITRQQRARIYTERQVETLKAARALVQQNDGLLSIEQALRRVLGLEVLIEPRSSAIQTTEPTALERLLESLNTISNQNAQLLENQDKIQAQNDRLLERLDSLEGQNRVLLGDNTALKDQLSEVKTITEKSSAQKSKGWFARVFGR